MENQQINSRPNKVSINTLLPIGLVMTIMGSVWFVATLTSDVRANATQLKEAKEEMNNLPTRTEFDTMKDDISIIKADIKTLLKEAK